MKKLIANIYNYTHFSYPAYTCREKEIVKPDSFAYEIGEVVVITGDNQLEIGVIIGCIDDSYGEVRTDTTGMVSMNSIRSAKLEDFFIPNIWFVPRLFEECKGLNL